MSGNIASQVEPRNGRFAAGLLDPDIAVPDFVGGPLPGPAERRYGVYRNNVVVGLIDALKSTYPSLHAIMGEENFVRVARNFAAARPPKSAMMQCFGEGFDTFLASFRPLRNSPFVADVARLEWACLEAWHAADAEPLDAGSLAALAPAEMAALVFTPHPAMALVSSAFPVADLFAWRFGRPEAAPDMAKAQDVLVTRPALEVETRTLDRTQCNFLRALSEGKPLGEAAALAEAPEFDLAAALGLALTSGAFASAAVCKVQ